MRNVVPLFEHWRKPIPQRTAAQPRPKGNSWNASRAAFDEMTDFLIMKQAEAGTLDPAIVAALLAAVRRPGREGDR